MKFKEFDARMRVYEEAHDLCVLPGMFMVARIDGRNFTRRTKEEWDLEHPFDKAFHAGMVATTKHLMDCGFQTIYGYTQSDEISLLLAKEADSFDRKLRKLTSILASEATSAFVNWINLHASFDSRISQLPTEMEVVDYFRWRRSDSIRNARNAYVYWTLRDSGMSPKRADSEARIMSWDEKTSFLADKGIILDDLPVWQVGGTGVWWREVEIEGIDPRDGSKHRALRKRLQSGECELRGDAYGLWLSNLLEKRVL